MQRLDISGKELPNFKELCSVDGKIYGRYNKVASVNPYKCYFIVSYPDGKMFKGNNLFETLWDRVQDGFCSFKYILSTGHVIDIPKYRAMKPMIEVSFGLDGSRIFHYVNVACLADTEVIIYKIVLRQDNIAPQKIGDIIMSRNKLPEKFDSGWKFTDFGR